MSSSVSSEPATSPASPEAAIPTPTAQGDAASTGMMATTPSSGTEPPPPPAPSLGSSGGGGGDVTSSPHNDNSDASQNIHPSSSNSNSSKKPNSSHFDAGSGVLADTQPQRPARRAFPQKTRASEAAAAAAATAATWKEREERARKILEKQEEERRQKAEEWRQQALAAQKHREQMEAQRRKVLQEARAKEQEKIRQMEERRKVLELADWERREALRKKNQEREERIENRRKTSGTSYAFGSSTPRMIEPRADSSTDIGGARRSTSSTNVHGLMSQSMYVKRGDVPSSSGGGMPGRSGSTAGSAKKSSSVYGLDKAAAGEGLSREGTSSSRLSPGAAAGKEVVHRRAPGTRASGARPRPVSIAVSGMTQSMYEKRPTSSSSAVSTPTNPRHHSVKNEVKSRKSQDDDVKSTTSSTSSVKGQRKTPAQVKRESAAKREKVKSASPQVPNTPQSEDGATTPTQASKREATPDIISDSDKAGQGRGAVTDLDVCENTDNSVSEDQKSGKTEGDASSTPAKKIITSEEEAKAKIAEKRRQMKEKKEREEELERQRLAELERIEEERRQKEEEEERRAMEEAERIAAEARKAEEERLEKAIAEAQKRKEEERVKNEEEERARKEQEQKAKEEAERKQAELDEKFRKEEEERLARKKRLEEIMARTRGGAKSTPSKSSQEEPAASPAAATPAQAEPDATAAANGEKPSSPENGEANGHNGVTQNHCNNGSAAEEIAQNELKSKPDLLSDTNEKNQMNSLTDFDPFGAGATKTTPKEVASVVADVTDNGDSDVISGVEEQDVDCQEEPVFDQILDLSCEKPGEAGGSQVMIGAPIIAFEDANSTSGPPATSISNQVEVPTADLLS